MRMCQNVRILAPPAPCRGFATKSKEEMTLHVEWLELAKAETKGKINIREKLIKETNEQMLTKPIYTADDVPKSIGEGGPDISGVFPYRRGHMATMYAARPWTVR